jgi:hypothetical protein
MLTTVSSPSAARLLIAGYDTVEKTLFVHRAFGIVPG